MNGSGDGSTVASQKSKNSKKQQRRLTRKDSSRNRNFEFNMRSEIEENRVIHWKASFDGSMEEFLYPSLQGLSSSSHQPNWEMKEETKEEGGESNHHQIHQYDNNDDEGSNGNSNLGMFPPPSTRNLTNIGSKQARQKGESHLRQQIVNQYKQRNLYKKRLIETEQMLSSTFLSSSPISIRKKRKVFLASSCHFDHHLESFVVRKGC